MLYFQLCPVQGLEIKSLMGIQKGLHLDEVVKLCAIQQLVPRITGSQVKCHLINVN